MCLCVCVCTCKPQVDPGSLPCSLFTLYMETGSLAGAGASSCSEDDKPAHSRDSVSISHVLGLQAGQSPPPTHTQEHRSSHLASTLPSKHLPRVMFCFVCSSVYAVLYYLTHDFSHETNNLTHHAFFPFKIFRHFP